MTNYVDTLENIPYLPEYKSHIETRFDLRFSYGATYTHKWSSVLTAWWLSGRVMTKRMSYTVGFKLKEKAERSGIWKKYVGQNLRYLDTPI